MILEYEKKLQILRESQGPLIESLNLSAMRIVTTGDWEMFSGTVIEIGHRLFVATASHCLSGGRSLKDYWVLSNRPTLHSDPHTKILAAYSNPRDNPDVGVLELDPPTFKQLCPEREPCPLNRVRDFGTGQSDRLICLLGAPRALLKEQNRGDKMRYKVDGIVYFSNPIVPSDTRWSEPDPSADETVDIFMEYPAGGDDNSPFRLDTLALHELPAPYGMSGGGLWDYGLNRGAIWHPRGAFLFGIQSAWHETKQYVRATQIRHWLRLVHRHYPDLREQLEERFTTIKW